MQCLKEARTKKQQKISLSGLEVKKLRKSRKTGVVISARTDAQKCFAEANSQYNLAAYTNHADEAYPLPVCTKAAELYDLEATELQKAYNGEESLSDVCKSLTKQADKLLQE